MNTANSMIKQMELMDKLVPKLFLIRNKKSKMKNQPTKQEIRKWCKALRSGKYQQGKNTLQSSNGYCCLGVACDIFIPKHLQARVISGRLFGRTPISQRWSPIWLKEINENFYQITGRNLSHLNDTSFKFDEIADLLEAVYIHEVLDTSKEK